MSENLGWKHTEIRYDFLTCERFSSFCQNCYFLRKIWSNSVEMDTCKMGKFEKKKPTSKKLGKVKLR